MANHVYTTINITGNKKVMEKLEEIKIKVEENNNDNHTALISGFYDNMENTFTWYGDNVGAKWCYHDEFWVDIEGEYAEIMTTSAWYPPIEFVQHIYKICKPLDSECEIDGDYENEAITPIGGFVINKNGFNHEEYDEDIEYPDEDNYQTVDEELDDEKYDEAVEEYHEKVSNLRGEMKSLAYNNLNKLLKSETTTT